MKNIKKIYLDLPKQHKMIISILTALMLLMLIIPSEKATASKQSDDIGLEVGKRYSVALPGSDGKTGSIHPVAQTGNKSRLKDKDTSATVKTVEQPTQTKQETLTTLTWQTAKVKSGDSLAKIFKRLGFNAKTTYQVSKAKGNGAKQLTKLNVGDTLRIGSNTDGKLITLEYALSKIKTIHVDAIEQGYVAKMVEKDIEIRQGFAHGIIKNNFWNSAIEAGMDDSQIINLANIFGWDIDFALDIRKGDSFHVVFENRYVDGEYIGTGNILAAEFINQDEEFKAIRFTDGDYYTPDGNSMRKAFLRAPVNFRYISSNFKPKRFHPIQKKWKAHNGTDYRANKGTPVVAAGNGKVTHSTYNRFNGNYVFIQHGDGVITKYLHFSKRAVKKGQRVKQGQVIGYVGSTGMSQAPHLHYEFLVNGKHRNPRTVKLPDAQPIAKKHRQAFTQLAKQRVKELNGSKQALLAMLTHNE